MTTNHIDQLTEWWENAEQGTIQRGDTVIAREPSGQYRVFTATVSGYDGGDDLRILARAPKPKPAWHDAPAVIAKGREDWDHVESFSRNDDYDPPRWIDNQGIAYTAEQLSDVAPLIEAKVTDEAVDRVLDVLHAWNDTYPAGLGTKLAAAALGVEAE